MRSVTVATTATTTPLTLLRLVDLDRAALELVPVQLRHRVRGGVSVTHRDEGEAARLARFTIGRHGNLAHFAECRKEGLYRVGGGTEREIPYEKTIAHG